MDANGAHPPLACCYCGDLFDGPERDCPSPEAGRAPLIDSGRGGHRFGAPPAPPPRKPMTAERLVQIEACVVALGSASAPESIIPELLGEVHRLRAECTRLKRCVLEGAGVFTREQIDRIMTEDDKPRRKRAA